MNGYRARVTMLVLKSCMDSVVFKLYPRLWEAPYTDPRPSKTPAATLVLQLRCSFEIRKPTMNARLVSQANITASCTYTVIMVCAMGLQLPIWYELMKLFRDPGDWKTHPLQMGIVVPIGKRRVRKKREYRRKRR